MITRSTIKHLLDFNPNTSRLRANEAALAVPKSGVIEDCRIKSPGVVGIVIKRLHFFISAAGFRDYKKHIWWLNVSAEVCARPTGTSGPDLSSDWLPVPSAVSIPCFCSACPQRALPFKGGGSYSQLCLSIPRWSFKRVDCLAWARGERKERQLGSK